MSGFKCFAFFFFLLAVPFSAACQEASIEQGLTHYTLYYPPYWEINEGQIEGLHAKLSRRLYAQAGLNVALESVPYARIHQRLFPSDVVIAAYGENPLTDTFYLFPIPKTTIELKIYGLHAEPVTSLEQLAGKDIAIKRGYPLGGFEQIRVEKKFNTVSTNTVEQAIRLLLIERVDYIITLDDPFQKDLKKIDLTGKKIWSRTLEKLDGWPIAVINSHPKATEVYEKIKKAYEELTESGDISYINKRLLLTEDL